ncbi:MAG: hypothetical protein ABR510_12655 [Trueperaceae bacterium]
MPRNPVATYRALLQGAREALDLPDDATTRSRLYTTLKPDRLAATPTLQQVLDELGIGAGYARNHLLSLGGWPDDVVARVEDGLPLASLAPWPPWTRASAARSSTWPSWTVTERGANASGGRSTGCDAKPPHRASCPRTAG